MYISWQLILVLLVSFLSSISLSAETNNIDTIVVTATRSNIAIEDATLPVTIIGRDQIEQSLARDIAQLLRFEAGLISEEMADQVKLLHYFFEELKVITR